MISTEFVQEPLHIKPAVAEVPMTFGQIRVNVNMPIRAGRVIYSDWIDTGLGQGVSMLNVELLDEEGYDCGPIRSPRIIFGRTDLFEEGEYIPCVPNVRMSEVLNTENGCFKVAVRFRENYSGPGFTLIWSASTLQKMTAEVSKQVFRPAAKEIEKASKQDLKPVTKEANLPNIVEKTVETVVPVQSSEAKPEKRPDAFYIENPPKLLHPGWKYTLRTNLGPDCAKVKWSAPNGAGVIDEYGEYTAPERQGMYEISASYNEGEMTASVYVVVMK